jgi:SNF2 family DNA or RNA helicase
MNDVDIVSIYLNRGDLVARGPEDKGLPLVARRVADLCSIYSELAESVEQLRDGRIAKIDLRIPRRPANVSLVELSRREALLGLPATVERLLVPLLSTPIPPPLYQYQTEGAERLYSTDRLILADDMGLGKSVQAIVALGRLLREVQIATVLVICPKTLVFNWLSEFERWDPDLCVNALLPPSISASGIWSSRFGRCHVVVTTYDHVRANLGAIPRRLDLLVADEAHRTRNLGSGVSRSIRTLQPKRFWMLSGTPVERDSRDLASLLSTLIPHQFTEKDAQVEISVLRQRARPFVLRRSKSEVLGQLPAHTEIVERLEMHPSQRQRYQLIYRDRGINFLTRFGKLREICDLDIESGESAKLDRICELIEDIGSIDERTVVFSYWIAPLEELERRLELRGIADVITLRGEMDVLARSRALKTFKKAGRVLLASAKIAAEGLTLTEANHVIFVNRWWNPSANNQALDRIRRIGQERQTFSYSFEMINTIEERVSSLLREKNDTYEELIQKLEREIDLSPDG